MSLIKLFFTSVFLAAISTTTFAQDSLKNDDYIQRKNVIRYNLTAHIVGFKAYIFGYERVVGPYQSFSINAGYLALGEESSGTNEKYDLVSSKASEGFSIAADYRFYFKNENKFKAPHGLYIGPYLASYLLKSNHTVRSTDASMGNPEVNIDVSLAIHNIGVELGYQFVIKNRFTVDLIFVGPSYSNYRLKMLAKGNVTISDPEVEEALEALKEILIEKYPWSKDLFDGGELDVKGNKSTWGLGFRYVIQVGYNF